MEGSRARPYGERSCILGGGGGGHGWVPLMIIHGTFEMSETTRTSACILNTHVLGFVSSISLG